MEQIKYEEYQKKVRESFDLYETDATVNTEDIGNCLRFLNFNPTKSQIKRIQQELSDEYIVYEKFEPVILKILVTNMFEDDLLIRDNEDTILRAFEVLDPERTGFIDSDKLVHLLETYGEPLDPEEVTEFRNAAEDPESHMIRYEDYSSILANE